MQGFYGSLERLMGMTPQVWRRHANPWSVLTRILVLPLLALAVWSRVWIGGWAWLAVFGVLVWTWANPRAFPPPASLDNWASRGVLGERVFLCRPDEIAVHHRAWARGLGLAAAPGLIVMIAGLWWLDAAWTVFGTVLTIGPKLWFLDRMNWIYADWLAATGKELGDV